MAKAYFPLYTSDYLRKTRHLSTKGHGAYLLLLLYLWDCDGEMKESPALIQRVTGMTEGEYRTVWRKELAPFFVITEGVITHSRVSEELEKRAEKLQKRCKAGAKGGKKTQQKQRERQANAQASQAKGLASPFQGERPSLPLPENEHVAASPPSPMEGGGDAPSHIKVLPDSAREIITELRALLPSHKVSLEDLDRFKKAVQGERAGRVILHPSYEPPPAVAEIINRPKLKLVTGD